MKSGRANPTDSYNILYRLQILSAIGCAFIAVYSSRFLSTGDAIRILGVGILVAGASLSCGFLLGFIFGIPRVGDEKQLEKRDSKPDDPPSPTNPSHVTSNSNLVEISDWLTKIMVGVGLVELNSIPHKLGKLSYYVGLGLRPAQCGQQGSCSDLINSAQVAGLAIVLFYFSVGFLGAYVWARLYFFKDLRGMIETLRRERVIDLIRLAEFSIDSGQLDEAMGFIDIALDSDPNDGRAILTKARILKRLALSIEKKDAKRVDQPEAKQLMLQALDCLGQAIKLLPHAGEPYYNRACYRALLGADMKEISSDLKTAFGLKPGLRELAADDPDLASVRQDIDFIDITKSHQQAKP